MKLKIDAFNKVKTAMIERANMPESKAITEIGFAVQIINSSLMLQKCSMESISQSIYNVSQSGLTLNPMLKYCYLIPRYDSFSKGYVCCLDPSYIGLIKLLTDTGNITEIIAQLVYENDVFEVNMTSSTDPILHRINGFEDRGLIKGAYVLAVLPNGNKVAEIMNKVEIDGIMETSEAVKSVRKNKLNKNYCPWFTYYGEMARKTVIKRIYKYLPKSDNVSKLISIDNRQYAPTESQINFAMNLLDVAKLPEDDLIYSYEQKIKFSNSSDELSKVIEELKTFKGNDNLTSQTEIKQKLNTL